MGGADKSQDSDWVRTGCFSKSSVSARRHSHVNVFLLLASGIGTVRDREMRDAANLTALATRKLRRATSVTLSSGACLKRYGG
jgi:hypothetical protein